MSDRPFRTWSGILGVVLDLQRVDVSAKEAFELGQELLPLGDLLRRGPRVGVDQVEAQPPEEQFLAKTGLGPLFFSGCLGYLASLFSARSGRGRFWVGTGRTAHRSAARMSHQLPSIPLR